MYDNSQTPPDTEHDWILSDTGKWYYYSEPGMRHYESGTIFQEGKGIIASPKAAMFTSENAAEMQARGVAAKRENAIQGFKRALEKKRGRSDIDMPDGDFVEQAFAEAVMEHALDAAAAGSAHVKRLAAELGGMLPDKRQAEVKDGRGNVVSGDVEFVERILRLAQEASARNQGDIDDGS